MTYARSEGRRSLGSSVLSPLPDLTLVLQLTAQSVTAAMNPKQAEAKARSKAWASKLGVPSDLFDTYDRAAANVRPSVADMQVFARSKTQALIAQAEAGGAPAGVIAEAKAIEQKYDPTLKDFAMKKAAALAAEKIAPKLAAYLPKGTPVGNITATLVLSYDLFSGGLSVATADKMARDIIELAASIAAAAACGAAGIICGPVAGYIAGDLYDAGKQIAGNIVSLFHSDAGERAAQMDAEAAAFWAVVNPLRHTWETITTAALFEVAKAYNTSAKMGLSVPRQPDDWNKVDLRTYRWFCFVVKSRVGHQQWMDDAEESLFSSIAGTYRTCWASEDELRSFPQSDAQRFLNALNRPRPGPVDIAQEALRLVPVWGTPAQAAQDPLFAGAPIALAMDNIDTLFAFPAVTERLNGGLIDTVATDKPHKCPVDPVTRTEIGLPEPDPWRVDFAEQQNGAVVHAAIVKATGERYLAWLAKNLTVATARWAQLSARTASVKLYVEAKAAALAADALAKSQMKTALERQAAALAIVKRAADDAAKQTAAQADAKAQAFQEAQAAAAASSKGTTTAIVVAGLGLAGIVAWVVTTSGKRK